MGNAGGLLVVVGFALGSIADSCTARVLWLGARLLAAVRHQPAVLRVRNTRAPLSEETSGLSTSSRCIACQGQPTANARWLLVHSSDAVQDFRKDNGISLGEL